MKTVTFYYVRHGETLFNQLNRKQGWCDSPLTEKGIQDAEEAGRILKDVHLDYAWTSSSERCRDTCAIVLAGRDIPVYESKGLKEINFGTFEAVFEHENTEELDRRRKEVDWADAGGDSYDSLRKRLLDTYQDIYEKAEDQDSVLIVSHGGVWLWLLKFLFEIEQEDFFRAKIERGVRPMPNGYTGVFQCQDGRWKLLKVRDLSDEDVQKLNGE